MRGGTAVAGFFGGRFRLLLARFQAADRNSTCKYVDEKILLLLYYDVDLFDPHGYEQTEPTCMVDVWYLWPCTP